ncbi:nucleoside-diphosphate sugar epimerase [bacterium DOLZORAL124_38_8]|nr:MAG: nucleoside-diphosphate sugar epimerase [bacterium DOLZORAL124_38_8]
MKKLKVLVTGGAGFIGSNFCNINKNIFEIVALDNLFLGDPSNLDESIRFIQGDAGKKEDLAQCGEAFDVILHLAGTSSAPMFNGDGLADGYVNSVQSFVEALEFGRRVGVKKILYASTSSLYGNNPMPLVETQQVTPPNHYACTKFLYENCAQCYQSVYPDMDIVGFRFMSVYGPNEEAKGEFANMISQFVWDVARDLSPVIFGDGNQFRDFTNVADIVQGITLAITTEKKLGNKVYNIGTGKTCSFNEILAQVNAAFGKNIQATYIENPVKETYVRGQHADITKIQSELGFVPKVSLADGVKAQVANLNVNKIRKTSSDSFRARK